MAIANVQHKVGDSAGSSSSQAVTVTSTTAGNCLLVCGMCGGNTTIAVSDNGATHATWVTLQAATFDSTLNRTMAIFVAYNIPSGITTVTLTYGGTQTGRQAFVTEWSGVATSAGNEPMPAIVTGTSATPTGPSITPSQNGELIYGYFLGPTNNFTVAAPWNATGQDGATTNHCVSAVDVLAAGSGTPIAPTCSVTSQYFWSQTVALATSPVSSVTPISASDTATLDDSGLPAIAVSGPADGLTLADTASVGPQFRDTASVDDLNVAVLATDVQTIPDFTLAEQSPTILAPTTLAETLTLSDALTVTVPVSAQDTLSLAESPLTVGLSVGDTLTAADTVSVVSLTDYFGYVVGTLAVAPRLAGTVTLTPLGRGTMTVQPAGRP